LKILIPRGGEPRALYSQCTHKLLSTLGNTQTRRASSVEPTLSLSERAKEWLQANDQTPITQDAWWADLTHVGGPVLGPFESRDMALDQEVKWLYALRLPANVQC